jgi:hypothetical protein
VVEAIEARLDGMNKAVELLQRQADKSPSIAEVALSVASLKELVQTQFRERDVRMEQASKSDKIAVDAALQAQKEAAGKQADNFKETIEKSETLFISQMESLKAQVSLLQGRIDRGEGRDDGKTKVESNNWTAFAVVGSLLIGLAGLIIAGAALFVRTGAGQ